MQKNLDTPDSATHTDLRMEKARRKRLGHLSTRGERIAHAREGVRMTQQQLADQCGVSRVTIVNTENGHRTNMKLSLVEQVATVTGVRVEWLLYGTGKKKTSRDPLDEQILITAAQMTVDELRDSILAAALSLPEDQRALLISDLEDADA